MNQTKQQETLPPVALPVAFAPTTEQEELMANDVVNVALATHITHEPIPLCYETPSASGVCPKCSTRTTTAPHAQHFDLPNYTQDASWAVQLLAKVLQTWPIEDLRLLGQILHGTEPQPLAFDILHILQKTSCQKLVPGAVTPWGYAKQVTEIRSGVFQVEIGQQGDWYQKQGLMIDTVIAYRDLDAEIRALGEATTDWFCFASGEPEERVLAMLARKAEK